MTSFNQKAYNPIVEEIVDVLCSRTQNTDRHFFRVEAIYFLAKIASSMRATVNSKNFGSIPVNIYAVLLAPSGFGKGHSVNLMEDHFLKKFRDAFVDGTMDSIADKAMWTRATNEAARKGTDPEDELAKFQSEYRSAGVFPFTFDSGTVPAVKQLRQKLLLAECGAISLAIDEIGSNLINNIEILNAYLELYDQGKIKQKLTKNTSESIRGTEIDGKTPTNMLLFGTPSKVFDGYHVENQFISFLETGYARRCLFGFGTNKNKASHSMTPTEIYHALINPTNTQIIDRLSTQFEKLANPQFYNWEAQITDAVAIRLLAYQLECEKQAELLPEHEDIQKAELAHRYFRAMKIAGIFAFLDQSLYVLDEYVSQAITLVEESGGAFLRMLDRERTYERLARYIASSKVELTHADLHEALPFYKKGIGARNEMMDLACAWGYKQHIIIKRTLRDGIDFFRGETLEESDPDNLMMSISDDFAYNYETELAPFDQLEALAVADGLHWCNHSFKDGHRKTNNTIPGFNTVVFDVDDGEITIPTVQELLQDYRYFIYTTKRHTDEKHRFRLIMPINYVLYFDENEYHRFMTNILEWMPFRSDTGATQRTRKWLTNPDAECYSNDGLILDALQFIPSTTKNEQYKESIQSIASLSHLERWFIINSQDGNRNNNLIKYALALADTGMGLLDIRKHVMSLNSMFSSPLPEDEIKATVLTSIAKRMAQDNDD